MATARSVALSRRFVVRTLDGTTERLQQGDDRLPPSGDPREVELSFDTPIESLTIAWEVAHQRMGPSMASSFNVPTASNETVIARGTLAPGIHSP